VTCIFQIYSFCIPAGKELFYLFNLYFISTSTLVSSILCFLLLFKKYYKRTVALLFLLTIMIACSSFLGTVIFQHMFHKSTNLLITLYTLSSITISLLCASFASSFLRERKSLPSLNVRRVRIPLPAVWYTAGVLVGIICIAFPWIRPAWIQKKYTFVLNTTGVVIYSFIFLIWVLVLAMLENTYRSAARYQRRITRLCFLALFAVTILQLFFLTRILLYKVITRSYIDMTAVTLGICLPLLLTGLLRYRLWLEKITVSQGIIYSSFSLFFIGAILLGLSVTVFIINRLGFSFTYFELFLLIFSGLFSALFILSSKQMRYRITTAVNTRIYKSKYDYRQQFLRLHNAMMASSNLQQTISRLLDNLKFTLPVENIYIFIRNSEDGNFYMHHTPETSVKTDLWISGDSPFVTSFSTSHQPLDFTHADPKTREHNVLYSEITLIQSLDISGTFPITHNNTLLGILAFKYSRSTKFDEEDIELITVFTESIGALFFNHQIGKERIEQKQFESFNHVASFVIHDIKNQVATLSLLTKNARSNLNNPDFQDSLLRSLTNCTHNLQNLIDKFCAPPKDDTLLLQPEDINTLLQKIITDSQLESLESVSVQTLFEAHGTVSIDAHMFTYIMINIINNALEAMDKKGRLTITTRNINGLAGEAIAEMGVSERFLHDKKIVISIADTGKGMDSFFIDTRLFHPFTSTKDKGIGIGLYQSKTLLEKMNGKILCKSKVNKGTTFYILL